MNKVRNFLIGGDVECFIQDKETKEIVSAEPYVRGSKHMPFNFDPSNPFFSTSLDNVLAEWNLIPTLDKDTWLLSFEKCLGYINDNLPPTLCTANIPSAHLQPEYLQSENAKRFGCDPDYNVWERSINPKPRGAKSLRSAGFHVTIGYEEPTISVSEELVKACDLYLSVPSVLMEPDNERKRLYGKAGCFRMPKFGVEYRSLSGYYAANRELQGWVFENTLKAIQFVNDERMDEIESVAPQIIKAINENDKVLAGNIVRHFNLELI